MVGTKVHVAYEIKDPPLIVKSNDEIEGKIIITNGEKKDKKLKSLYPMNMMRWVRFSRL